MTTQSDDKAAAPTDLQTAATEQWRSSIDRIRETAKWIAIGFGAIGGAIVGTAPLAGLGGLTWDRRGLAAIGFGVVALVGVGVVIGFASGVLLPRAVTLHDLAYANDYRRYRETIDRDPSSYLWPYADTVAEFYRMWRRNLRSLRLCDALSLDHGSDPKAVATIETARGVLADRVTTAALVAGHLLTIGVYDQTRRQFARARIAIFIGGGLTAIGIAGFLALTPAASG